MAFGKGDIDRVSQSSSESLAVRRRLGDKEAEGYALVLTGLANVFRGDLEAAASFIEEGAAGGAEAPAMLPGINIAKGRRTRRDELADELGHDDFAAATVERTQATEREVAGWLEEVQHLVA